jgi:multisubunit Na+/H+ antiporter MnhG subunit
VKEWLIDALLFLTVAASWLGTIGLLMPRSAYDRLHAVGFASVTTGLLGMAAIIVQQPLASSALKAVIIAAVSIVGGTVLAHAIGRALRIRDESTDRSSS